MKFCTKCKKHLPINMFHKNKSKKDGLAGQCRWAKENISKGGKYIVEIKR